MEKYWMTTTRNGKYKTYEEAETVAKREAKKYGYDTVDILEATARVTTPVPEYTVTKL